MDYIKVENKIYSFWKKLKNNPLFAVLAIIFGLFFIWFTPIIYSYILKFIGILGEGKSLF